MEKEKISFNQNLNTNILEDLNLKGYSVFETKPKKILVKLVTDDYKIILDKNGEEFTGLKGDFEIIDENGYTYFINKYVLLENYKPVDMNSFKLLLLINGYV